VEKGSAEMACRSRMAKKDKVDLVSQPSDDSEISLSLINSFFISNFLCLSFMMIFLSSPARFSLKTAVNKMEQN
jgi:hypothetical protein